MRRLRLRHESGSASIELVIMTPVIVMLIGLGLLAGRSATTRQDVISASRDAARAASVRQFPGPAQSDATAAAQTTLAGRNVSCQSLLVDVDTSGLVPGGTVTATVTCEVALNDVTGLLGLPGSVTITETSTAVVDRFRGGS